MSRLITTISSIQRAASRSISDVLVGLLARLFVFFDQLPPDELERQRNRMSVIARENISTILDVILRSNKASPTLIHNINADTELILRDYCLGVLCD